MTFEGRNLYGHTYNHDEVFSKSKHKKWRPAHHELAFGKATTRPPWYRSEKYGGVSQLPPADAGRRYEPKAKDMPAQPSGPSSMLHHFTGESRHELAHSSNTVKVLLLVLYTHASFLEQPMLQRLQNLDFHSASISFSLSRSCHASLMCFHRKRMSAFSRRLLQWCTSSRTLIELSLTCICRSLSHATGSS